MRLAGVLAAALIALPACAQVEVMEPGMPAAYDAPRRAGPAPVQPGASNADLYNQVLQLQDEVMKLHGIVEEQAEQLRQLKQQRLDDYISLDKRLTALGSGSAAPSGGGAADAQMSAAPAQQPASAPIRADVAPRAPAAVPTAPVAGEQQAYQAAFELIRNRRFPEATAAFKAFLQNYPQGALSGNAHFWLGELYLLDGNSEAAKPHYESLVYQFPGSSKMPDGLFKLGRIYHQEGDNARAKELLQRVVTEYGSSDSAAPRLAREYMQQNGL